MPRAGGSPESLALLSLLGVDDGRFIQEDGSLGVTSARDGDRIPTRWQDTLTPFQSPHLVPARAPSLGDAPASEKLTSSRRRPSPAMRWGGLQDAPSYRGWPSCLSPSDRRVSCEDAGVGLRSAETGGLRDSPGTERVGCSWEELRH